MGCKTHLFIDHSSAPAIILSTSIKDLSQIESLTFLPRGERCRHRNASFVKTKALKGPHALLVDMRLGEAYRAFFEVGIKLVGMISLRILLFTLNNAVRHKELRIFLCLCRVWACGR